MSLGSAEDLFADKWTFGEGRLPLLVGRPVLSGPKHCCQLIEPDVTPMSRTSTGHDWKDWHLTPEGWIPGNRRADIAEKRISAIPVPMGCVLTLRWHTFLPTEHAAPASYYTRVLRGKSEAKVSELLKRYGEDPQSKK